MVRPQLAVLLRSFIPFYREPFQIFQNVLFKDRRSPFLIGVFNPQDEIASIVFGKEPIKQGCSGIPDMKVPRRRWCKSDPPSRCHLPSFSITVATAKAALPSPRPRNPIPSLVFALTLTFSIGMFNVFEIFNSMSCM